MIPWPALLALITLPEAYALIQIMLHKTDTASLHQAQGRTAKLHGRLGFLMVAGWLIYIVVGLL